MDENSTVIVIDWQDVENSKYRCDIDTNRNNIIPLDTPSYASLKTFLSQEALVVLQALKIY